MRWRGRNGANPGMVPPWGRGSDSRNRAQGREALSGGSDGGRGRNGCGSRGYKSSGGNSKGYMSSGGSRGPGLGLPVGGGEDYLTLGFKLCPPLVFTIAELEKEQRWRGREEERFQK